MTQILAWLLGFERVTSIDSIGVVWAAPWARDRSWLVVTACLLAVAAAVAFYTRGQAIHSRTVRVALSSCRALLLALLVITLAAPILNGSGTIEQLPLLYLIVDDTASLRVADSPSADSATATRAHELHKLLRADGVNLLGKLQDIAHCRVKSFVMTGDDECRLEPVANESLPDDLQQAGQVTDLNSVLRQIARQTDAHRLAAVILCSDFADKTPAQVDLAVPVHTLGLGAQEFPDVAVALRGETQAKAGEVTTVQIDVHQSGMSGREVEVVLLLQPLSDNKAGTPAESREIERRTIALTDTSSALSIPWTPDSPGLVELTANIAPLDGEVIHTNNSAAREVRVVGDALRLLYVAHEPTWEWRFIKEVFQRDKLVGRDGFRTYLATVDPRVPAENELFLPELATGRSDFFQHDVLFLDDVPTEMLTPDFCDRVEEFVGRFGGGLVVIAGPRFGPQQLATTSLGQLLPVVIDPDSQRLDVVSFQPKLTAEAALYPFLRLDATDAGQAAAWVHLSPLSWYQPSLAVHEQAHIIAAHPTDVCEDGQTPQPLLAIRPYGHGQVVYLAMNETWRWRRRYGELYHQRFWSQLVHRLAMSHSLGNEKRFRAEFNRREYAVGARATFSVSVFDADFLPLSGESAAGESLAATLIWESATGSESRSLTLNPQSAGEWQADVSLPAAGRYQVRIVDPVTKLVHDRHCVVTDTTPELQPMPRNVELQRRIAAATGGRAYEISQVDQLVSDLQLTPTLERQSRELAVWHTPAWFVLVVGLMLGEWITRRMAALR